MNRSIPHTTTAPTSGLHDVIEGVDERDGFETEDAARRLGSYLLRLVRDGDHRAEAAGRKAPRTVAEMRQRLAAEASDEDDLNRDLDKDYSQEELDEILGGESQARKAVAA